MAFSLNGCKLKMFKIHFDPPGGLTTGEREKSPASHRDNQSKKTNNKREGKPKTNVLCSSARLKGHTESRFSGQTSSSYQMLNCFAA